MQIQKIPTKTNFGMPIIKIGNSCDLKQEIADLTEKQNSGLSSFDKKELIEATRQLNKMSGYHNIIGTLGWDDMPPYITFEPISKEALAGRISLGIDRFGTGDDLYIDAYTSGMEFTPEHPMGYDPVKFIKTAVKILPILEPRISGGSGKEKILEHLDK